MVAFFKMLSRIGVDMADEIYQRHRVILTNQLTAIILLSLIVRLAINVVNTDRQAASLTAFLIVLFSLTFLLNYRKHYATARLYVLILLILVSYLVILTVTDISYGTLIGFYFVELNALIAFLLLFDKNYDSRSLYYGLFVIVILKILIHDQIYLFILDDSHPLVEFSNSASYVYFKLPQLTVALILLAGLRLWQSNFREYLSKLEQLSREVQEKNEEIMTQNEELSAQTTELENQNSLLTKSQEEVLYVNSNLEEIIRTRTKLIQEQNAKLIEYSFHNAHKVRGPLARILGVIQLMQVDKSTDPIMLHQLLTESAMELDSVIREINVVLSTSKLEDNPTEPDQLLKP